MRSDPRIVGFGRLSAAVIAVCGFLASGSAGALAGASPLGGATINVQPSKGSVHAGEKYTITTSGQLPHGAGVRQVAVFLDRVACPATQLKASDYEIGAPATETVPAGHFKIAQHYTDSSGASRDYFCAYATFTAGGHRYEIHAGVEQTWSS